MKPPARYSYFSSSSLLLLPLVQEWPVPNPFGASRHLPALPTRPLSSSKYVKSAVTRTQSVLVWTPGRLHRLSLMLDLTETLISVRKSLLFVCCLFVCDYFLAFYSILFYFILFYFILFLFYLCSNFSALLQLKKRLWVEVLHKFTWMQNTWWHGAISGAVSYL